MNRKGFTLIELLAVLVVLGIITGIAVQSYFVLVKNNDESKYTYYLDLIKKGVDLHLESKKDTMQNGECIAVSYQGLIEKNYIKEEDVVCEGYVILSKNGRKFTYDDTALSCKTKSGGKVLKEKTGEKNPSCREVN